MLASKSAPDVLFCAAWSMQHKHILERLQAPRGFEQLQSHDKVVVLTKRRIYRLIKVAKAAGTHRSHTTQGFKKPLQTTSGMQGATIHVSATCTPRRLMLAPSACRATRGNFPWRPGEPSAGAAGASASHTLGSAVTLAHAPVDQVSCEHEHIELCHLRRPGV